MKRYKYPLIIIIALCLLSCKKDFLNIPDNSIITRQDYVKDLKTTEEYLNGIYVLLGKDFFYGYNLLYPELIADNIKPAASVFSSQYGWSQIADIVTSNRPSASSKNMNSMWTTGYSSISACNFILEKVDSYKNENVSKADDIKGQAYALRALIHFIIANVFSQSYNFTGDASHIGIPYVTVSDWKQSFSRQTVAEVYGNIIGDLNNAIQLLPSNSSSTLLMNRNAVKALLARVYLFKGALEEAKNLASEISNTVPITKINAGYPDTLFKLLPPQQTEAIFQLPPAAVGVSGGLYNTAFVGQFFTSPTLQFLSTGDMASILKEDLNDIRNKWVSQSGTTWNITKYPKNVVAGFSNTAASYYQTILRSSEMYLIAAECYAKLEIEDSARFYLNAIRKRANPAKANVIAIGAALIDSIYKERRKEFAFEGFRMFDLLRWKQGIIRSNETNQALKSLIYPSNKAIAPIPDLDVELEGLQQNVGY